MGKAPGWTVAIETRITAADPPRFRQTRVFKVVHG